MMGLTWKQVKIMICSAFIAILGTTVWAGTERGDYHVVYDGQTIDNLIINYMEANNVPGLSMAIVQAPYITRIVGYGIADQQNGNLVATHTLFDIGQIANAFTAVAIMQLKEEQKLNLEDSISKYITNAPQNWQKITIKDLLMHSSGLPSYTDTPFDYSQTYTTTDILNLVKGKPLIFEPGSKVELSDTNNYLLGLIIEKASGMSYQDYITKNQIERIGLKHTFVAANIGQIKNELNNGSNPFKHSQFLHDPQMINPAELAVGYREDDTGKLVPVKPNQWTASYANSGIVASSEDISTWDIGLAGTILVKDPKNREFLYQSITLKNNKIAPGNVGWLFPGHKGLMEIKGNVPGFSSFLSRFTAPADLLCVTLLVNKEGLPDLDILGRKIAGAYVNRLAAPKGAPWSETLQSPYPVTETIDRVAALVKAQGGKVFARINQSKEAADVNQTLPETEVLIIGNPAKGTALMQANAAIALDLPIRVMATTSADGLVWLSFTDPVALGRAYQLDASQSATLKQMSQAIRKIAEKAVSVSQIK